MDETLERAVLAVADRAAELRERSTAREQALDGHDTVERWVSSDAEGLLSIVPPAARINPEWMGEWLDAPGPYGDAERVLVGSDGRPLVHERPRGGYVLRCWRYCEGFTEEVGFRNGVPHVTWVLASEDARPVWSVGADSLERWVERWTWAGEQVVRVEHGAASPRGWPRSFAVEAEFGPDGEVSRLRRGTGNDEFREDNRLGADDWLPALAQAFERATLITSEETMWPVQEPPPAPERPHVDPRSLSVDPDVAARALRDRDTLAELCAHVGLKEHASRLAHEVAAIGHLLRPTEREGGSRLGGPALLPPGEEWPLTADGRPLVFLAAIDLTELTSEDLPTTGGWWLFFADLGEDAEGDVFYEPEPNADGARGRMFHVPASAGAPEDAHPPGESLKHRAVKLDPLLTLPDHYDVAESLALDPDQAAIYDALHSILDEALLVPALPWECHWVGGHQSDAQGHPPEDNSVLLFHVSNDHSLGFDFLDGGTIQFRIDANELASGEYSAVEIEPSSS